MRGRIITVAHFWIMEYTTNAYFVLVFRDHRRRSYIALVCVDLMLTLFLCLNVYISIYIEVN